MCLKFISDTIALTCVYMASEFNFVYLTKNNTIMQYICALCIYERKSMPIFWLRATT